MIITQVNVKILLQVILKVMIQIMQLCKIMATEIESDDMHGIDRYRKDTEYLNL